MSEENSFLSDIVNQLNGQEPLVQQNEEQAPQAETAEEPQNQQVEEPQQVEKPQQTESQPEAVEEEQVEKAWYEQEPEAKEETQETPKKESTKAEEFPMDEDLKLIMDYKKSGKTLADFVKEYRVEDYNEWDDAKIVKEGLKEFMSLSKEELEQAVYEYENASVFQKKQWAESFKDKFENKNSDMLKQLSSSSNQAQQEAEAIANKFKNELDSYTNSIVDKEVYGLKVTDEMSDGLKDFIEKDFSFNKEDGSLDVEKVFSVALWMKHGADLVKANITKAKNEGKEQVIKEVSNPSKNYTNVGKSVGTGIDAAQEAFDQLFQLNNN